MFLKDCSKISICPAVDAAKGVVSGSVVYTRSPGWENTHDVSLVADVSGLELNESVADRGRFMKDLEAAVVSFLKANWYSTVPSPVLPLVVWPEVADGADGYGFWIARVPDTVSERRLIRQDSPLRHAKRYSAEIR